MKSGVALSPVEQKSLHMKVISGDERAFVPGLWADRVSEQGDLTHSHTNWNSEG